MPASPLSLRPPVPRPNQHSFTSCKARVCRGGERPPGSWWGLFYIIFTFLIINPFGWYSFVSSLGMWVCNQGQQNHYSPRLAAQQFKVALRLKVCLCEHVLSPAAAGEGLGNRRGRQTNHWEASSLIITPSRFSEGGWWWILGRWKNIVRSTLKEL